MVGCHSQLGFQKLYYSKQYSFYYYIPEQQYSSAHAFLSTEIDWVKGKYSKISIIRPGYSRLIEFEKKKDTMVVQ